MRSLFLLLLVLFLVSCANQGNLTGGAKDETPPKLLSAAPANQTLNFSSKGFELFFDENIKVTSLKENLLISPFLNEKPTIKVRPRSILVEFEEDLMPNTTYTFNFGSAIADLNEGNELAGFTYVFSTGHELDSLSLGGEAIEAKTGKALEPGAWAVLYSSLEDSMFFKSPPNYVAPILEDGSFAFQNLKEGEYRLYALIDNNLNYFFDLPNEQVGFLDNTIKVGNQQVVENAISVFLEEPKQGFVRKVVNDQAQSLLFETSTDAQRFNIQAYNDKKPTYKSTYFDSIRMWFAPSEPLPDSLAVYFDDVLIDTLNYIQRVREVNDSTFKVRIKNTDAYSKYKPIYIHSSRPFERNTALEDPKLLEDSLFVAGGIQLKRDSLDARKFYLDYNWAYGKNYIVEFDDSCFINFLGLPSDSLFVEFSTPKVESLSTLQLNITSNLYKGEPLLFRLMKKDEIFYEAKLTQGESLTLTELPAGKYTSQVIIDSNGNGLWDTGSFSSKTQPERVLNFETEIELRPNWDLEVEINIEE